MQDYDGLIMRLRRWGAHRGTYAEGRALADEVLRADGWEPFEDEGFEGGGGWKYGRNPTVFVSHESRPQPLWDLSAAVAVVPPHHNYKLEVLEGCAVAHVWPRRPRPGARAAGLHRGESSAPEVAMLIAALQAIKAVRTEEEATVG